VPPVSGTYRLGFSSADDIGYLWMGPPASARTWGESNWNVRATFFAPSTATVSQSFIAGQLYPIQILLANGGGDGGMQFSIVTPTGSTVSDTTGYFLQPSCGTSGLAVATVQPSAGLGTPNTITVTSGSVRYTSTVPTTVNGVATQVVVVGVPAPTCTASGLAYAAFSNPFTVGATPANPYYLGFDPSYFRSLSSSSALFSGVATNINFDFVTGAGLLYESTSPRNLVQTAIIYTGYFMPPTSGIYTLSFPQTTSAIDDVAYMWMGTTASTGTWSETNWNLRSTYTSPSQSGGVSGTFSAGQLYPIVILYANAPERAALQLNIRRPDGSIVTNTAGYFLQPVCGTLGLPIATNQPSVPSCAATGIEYINRPAPTATPAGLFGLASATFNPDNYSPPTASPYSTVKFQGVTDDISFTVASPGTSATVYGHGPYDLTASGTFFRGYFVANVTGNYTFSLNQPDDVGYMWLGTNAISSWTSANAQIRGATVAGASGTFTTTLTAGVLNPIRLAFGNAGGAMSYTLAVRDPNGVTKSQTNGFFVQPWCGTTPRSSWT
jgi:hypothetical protein